MSVNKPATNTESRVAWVMGGSSGFGLHLAKAVAAAGYRVVLFGRDAERLAAASNEVSSSTTAGVCQTCQLDVLNLEQVRQVLPQQFQLDGRLDLLINCVGKSCRVAVEEATPEMYSEWMEANFQSAVNVTMTSLDWLLASNGSIVNIGSLAARVPWRWIAPYAASKQALASFSDSLRIELNGRVHVLLVCPGPITRDDAGQRYQQQSEGLQKKANAPGAGAPVKTLDPVKLSRDILAAVAAKRSELMVPRKTRLLQLAYGLGPGIGDWLLRRLSKS